MGIRFGPKVKATLVALLQEYAYVFAWGHEDMLDIYPNLIFLNEDSQYHSIR